MHNANIAFFGTSQFSIYILDELLKAGIKPKLIVTTPDKPQGRKLIMTPPPVKVWAETHNIPYLQPAKLRDGQFVDALNASLENGVWDMFIVASYGKIIPKDILDIPRCGSINVHPSLLPKLRGASPLQFSILEDMKDTGVTIIKMDEEVDHGPILAQTPVTIDPWPPTTEELEKQLGEEGGRIIAFYMEQWLTEPPAGTPQNHEQATYTRKISKEDGLIDLSSDPYQNFLKIQAFSKWPTAYYFHERKSSPSQGSAEGTKKIRVIIKKAAFNNGKLEILRVVPEGKKEMDYKDFIRS
jgi:methionyl-tRNA formyltransferase